MNSAKMLLQLVVVSSGTLWLNSCFGQATYYFNNFVLELDAPVFNADGSRLFGTNYLAIVYGGPSVDSLTPALNGDGFGLLAPAPFTISLQGQTGYFAGPSLRIASVPCGGPAWLQVRAWDARLGESYEEVAGLDLGGYGESNLFQARGGLPHPCAMLPTQPEPLRGLQSFALREVIPEPSSTLLLLLGLPALLFFRRRSP